MRTNLLVPFLGILMFLLAVSCVKDTDFNQAENIAPTPIIELDLVYFNIAAGEFFDETTSTPRLTVTDTTDIRFLDGSDVQETLKRAEFLFRFTNSIEREFQVNFQFLSEQNDTTYTAGTVVQIGTTANPVITEFTENVEGDAIFDLTRANKVVVSVTIPSSNAQLEGDLNLQSKTTYYLEL